MDLSGVRLSVNMFVDGPEFFRYLPERSPYEKLLLRPEVLMIREQYAGYHTYSLHTASRGALCEW